MILQGKQRYRVREAVLHCTGAPAHFWKGKNSFQVFAEINKWHRERGWKGFGYHGLFMPDGTFFRGRPFDMIGAHVMGHNRGTLGFLLVESETIKTGAHMGRFEDYFTEAQRHALRSKLADCEVERVTGHNDYAPKLCPGFKVQSSDWL